MTIDKESPASDAPSSELLWQPGQTLDDGAALAPNEPASGKSPTDEPASERQSAKGHSGDPASDSELAAYRRGELPAPDRERIEDALIRSPEIRARLAAKAGVKTVSASPSVRDRVLEAFEREMGDYPDQSKVLSWRRPDHEQNQRPPSPKRRRSAWIALAASGILALLWLRPVTKPLPSDLYWQVEAQGISAMRGSAPESTPSPEARTLEIAPETRLRIEASPNREAQNIEFALFRRLGQRPPERLPLTADMLIVERGAARVDVQTSDLLGFGPESGELIWVAAPKGGIPSPEQLAESLHARSPSESSESWRAHILSYRLVTAR